MYFLKEIILIINHKLACDKLAEARAFWPLAVVENVVSGDKDIASEI